MSHSGGVSSVCPLSSLHLWLQSSVCSLRRAVWHHIQNGRGAQCMLRENTHNNTLPEATFALCYSLGTVSLFWPKCYSFVHSLHKAGQTLVINNCLWIGTAGSILRGQLWSECIRILILFRPHIPAWNFLSTPHLAECCSKCFAFLG